MQVRDTEQLNISKNSIISFKQRKRQASNTLQHQQQRFKIHSSNEKCKLTHRESDPVNNIRSGVGSGCNYYCTSDIISIYNNKNAIGDHVLYANNLNNQTHKPPVELKVNRSKNLYGKLRKTISLDNALPTVENVYENLCEHRNLARDSSLSCTFCEGRRKNPSDKRSNKLREFLGNLKRKTSLPLKKDQTKRLEIIHNVQSSGGVFKTQDSFDLGEICQMRDDIFLRKNSLHSNTSLTDTYRKFQVYEDENIYENLDFNKSSDSIAESERDEFEFLNDWRNSIRHETHDYEENNFFYLKSIPSYHQAFACDENIVFLRNKKFTSYSRINESYTKVLETANNENTFEKKRRCVYFPDRTAKDNAWKQTEISIILQNSSNNSDNESSDFLNGLLKLFDAYLAKYQCVVYPNEELLSPLINLPITTNGTKYETISTENVISDANNAIVDIKQLITLPQSQAKNRKATTKPFQNRRKINKLLSVHHLSVSLNTITLFYWQNDKKIKCFISKLISLRMNFYQDTVQLVIEQLGSALPSLDLQPCDTANITEFLLLHSHNSLKKIKIDDFVIPKKNFKMYQKSTKENNLQVISEVNEKHCELTDKIQEEKNKPLTDSTIELLNTNSDPIITFEETNDIENIYQPIWTCQTEEGLFQKVLHETEENLYETIHTQCAVDMDKWVVADEFAFGNSRIEHIQDETAHSETAYTTICILFDPLDASLNHIIYDYVMDQTLNQGQIVGTERNVKNHQILDEFANNYSHSKTIYNFPTTVINTTEDWHTLLKSPFYCDDEEDVIMAKKILHKSHSTSDLLSIDRSQTDIADGNKISSISNNSKQNTSVLAFSNYDSSKACEIDELPKGIYKRIDSEDHNNETLETTINTSDKRKAPRTNIRQIVKFNARAKDDDCVKYSPKIGRNFKKSGILFGVELNKVEKYENSNIPKFVVDCITILNSSDKICTQGIYRASGNKITIEALKKQLNSPRSPKKETALAQVKLLEEHEIHTITGLLKLYFRELKTPLIPKDIFEACTKNKNTNIKSIASHMQTIKEPAKSILQYLFEHLKNVDKHSNENMMTSTNLSIVWGACIFAATVNEMSSVDNNDIKRINKFVCDLINNCEIIFGNQLDPPKLVF